MDFKITFGKCPRCESDTYGLLIEIPGLEPFCKKCLNKTIKLLGEADKRPLKLEDIIRILKEK